MPRHSAWKLRSQKQLIWYMATRQATVNGHSPFCANAPGFRRLYFKTASEGRTAVGDDLRTGVRSIKEIVQFDDEELTEEKIANWTRQTLKDIDKIAELYKTWRRGYKFSTLLPGGFARPSRAPSPTRDAPSACQFT
jgi:hypothetical protein